MKNELIFLKKIDAFTRLDTSTFIFFIIVSERVKTSIFLEKFSHYSSFSTIL